MARWVVPAWVLAEIAAFVVVGGRIGVLGVLGLIALTGVAGVILLRQGGLRALGALRAAGPRGGMRGPMRGRDPLSAIAEGGTRAAAGLLLLLPGFLGDTLALALLVPPLRRLLLRGLLPRGLSRQVVRTGPAGGPAPRTAGLGADRRAGPIAEADWEEVEPRRPDLQGAPDAPMQGPTGGGSGWTRP